MKVAAREDQTGWQQRLVAPGLILLGYGLLTWAGLMLAGTPVTGGSEIPTLWLAEAFLVSALIWYLRRPTALFFAASFATVAAAYFLSGATLLSIIGMPMIALLEVSVVYFGMRRFASRKPHLADIRDLITFWLLGGLALPLVSSGPAILLESQQQESLSGALGLGWFMAKSLGMMIGGPVFFAIFHRRDGRDAKRRRSPIEKLTIVGLCLAATIAVFSQNQYPLLFITTLFVLLAAFRLGISGAATVTLSVAVIAMMFSAVKLGPIQLVQGSPLEHTIVLQVFLLGTLLAALPVAAGLANRDKLRRELEQSRDFAKSVLDNIQEVLFRTDARGRISFLNPAWETLTGIPSKDALGRPLPEMLANADGTAAQHPLDALLSGKVDQGRVSMAILHADGVIREIEVRASVVRDARNGNSGIIGSIFDVTESKQALSALAESERRFHTLSELSPAGIFRSTVGGELSYVNQAWLDFTGFTMEQANGRGWLNSIHPEDRDWLNEAAMEAVSKGENLRAEYRYLRPDGSITYAMGLSTPERDQSGNVSGIIGVVLDVTDIVAARRELNEERRRFQFLADNATDAIVTMAPDGTCTYASNATFELTGYTPEEIIGKEIVIPVEPEDLEGLVDIYERMFAGDLERARHVYRVQHKTKGWRWHESLIRLVRNPETGKPEETIASVRDVTERIELEEDLRKARDEAESAAKAKSSFLANMSHEIRTPMNGVLGFTDLLLESELSPEQRKQVELIAESGRSMATLLNDILDLSKIDAGQMQISKGVVDIRHTINGIVRLMRAAATQKGVAVECSFDDEIPQLVEGDKLRLRQILANLIGNAVKFTHEGSIEVTARVNSDGEDRQLEIAVADTGIGIEAGHLASIFDEFVQADSSAATMAGGTGLGLQISRRLAELMGGTVTVESTVGEGSTFTLHLPITEVDPSAYAAHDAASGQAGTISGQADAGQATRVLIAEDLPTNQLLLGAMIERFGLRYDLAEDGLIAVNMVTDARSRGTPYSLVLMDMQMPNMGGLDATRKIREEGIAADELPIIAVTANAFDTDVQACLDAGMQGHLGKPILLKDLGKIFDEWLPQQAKAAKSGSKQTVN